LPGGSRRVFVLVRVAALVRALYSTIAWALPTLTQLSTTCCSLGLSIPSATTSPTLILMLKTAAAQKLRTTFTGNTSMLRLLQHLEPSRVRTLCATRLVCFVSHWEM